MASDEARRWPARRVITILNWSVVAYFNVMLKFAKQKYGKFLSKYLQ
jgi:hypothetical protein